MKLSQFNPYARKMRSAEGVGFGQTGHIEIKGGSTIHMIELQTNILDPALIKRVWLTIGSRVIFQFTGEQLKMLDALKKYPSVAGKYVIQLSDLIYRTREGVTSGKLPTSPNEEIFLNFELGENEGNAKIKGRYWLTDGERRVFTPNCYTTTFDAPSSGVNDLIWKNGKPTSRIRRLHLQSDKIEQINVYRDNRLIHEIEKANNKEDLQRYGNLAPQAGYFHFDPTLHGFGWDGLFSTHGQELKFEIVTSEPVSIPILVELLEQTAPLEVAV